jgi:hypothetical protein
MFGPEFCLLGNVVMASLEKNGAARIRFASGTRL